jgi:hypothetical protein
MVLPMPVVDLWRWSVRASSARIETPTTGPTTRPLLSVIPGGAAMAERPPPTKSAAWLARQRLEDQFRQAYREQQATVRAASDIADVAMQSTSIGINRMTDGSAS